MRKHLLSVLFCFAARIVFAQQDYFVAEDLAYEGKHAEAIVILNNLIRSDAYVDRPGMHMKTLNLAGSVNRSLKDTVQSKACYQSAIGYYDTLNNSNKQNTFIKREWYIANKELARLSFAEKQPRQTLDFLNVTGPPGEYYSATGHDVLIETDSYYNLKSKAFRVLGKPDSAFWFLCLVQEENPLFKIGLLFRNPHNKLVHVEMQSFAGPGHCRDCDSGYFYVATWTDEEQLQSHSVWCADYDRGSAVLIGQSGLSPAVYFPASADKISLSPSGNWLAVETHSGNNTWIEVVNFKTLIEEQRYVQTDSLDPLAGTIHLLGWQNNAVIIDSDVNLIKLNKGKDRTNEFFILKDERKTFLYDIDKKKYSLR